MTTYDEWRSKIPWTDEEIAEVFDRAVERREAEGNTRLAERKRRTAAFFRRTHHLTRSILSEALYDLVKVCCVCGKVALYRRGSFGYCRNHKHVLPDFVKVRQARLELRAKMFADEAKERDDRDLSRLSSKTSKKFRN